MNCPNREYDFGPNYDFGDFSNDLGDTMEHASAASDATSAFGGPLGDLSRWFKAVALMDAAFNLGQDFSFYNGSRFAAISGGAVVGSAVGAGIAEVALAGAISTGLVVTSAPVIAALLGVGALAGGLYFSEEVADFFDENFGDSGNSISQDVLDEIDQQQSDISHSQNGSDDCEGNGGFNHLFDHPPVSPLVFDLDSDGIELISLANSNAMFDLDGDQFRELTGWVGGDDGLLAIDLNGNGQIDDINELFGNETTDGFIELAALDTNFNGFIDPGDTQFNDLLIWQDANSNGYSSEDELASLTNWSIENINLNYITVNETNQGHTISTQSVAGLGGNILVQDVWFQHSQYNSSYIMPDGFIYDEDVFLLPTLRGFGNAPDLWVAMTIDSSLKTLVDDLVHADYSNFSFSSFSTSVEQILFKWLGVENIDPASRGPYIDARIVEGVEKWIDRDFVHHHNSPNPALNAGAFMESMWDDFVGNIATRLLVQIPGTAFFEAIDEAYNLYNQQADFFSLSDQQITNLFSPIFSTANNAVANHPFKAIADAVSYDHVSNMLIGDFTALVQVIEDNEPVLAQDKETYWHDMLPVINAVANSQELSSADYNAALTNTYLGDYGQIDDLTALRTHRILSGSDTSEIIQDADNAGYLIGGSGDDTLKGHGGGDIYAYDIGDGNDTIDESGGFYNFTDDPDKLLFGPGITANDLSFTRTSDDIFTNEDVRIDIAGGGSVYIKSQLTNGDRNIETIQFSDASTISQEEIRGIILNQSMTDGDDTIEGYFSQETLIGGLGDDSLKGDSGNDSDEFPQGDSDTYIYNLGDGNDTINDYSGEDDQIVFGPGITQNDITITRTGDDAPFNVTGFDILIEIASGGSIYVYNQFLSNEKPIDKLVFDDGSIITKEQIRDMLLSQSTTNGDDLVEGYYTDDTIIGSLGDDSLLGSPGSDTYIYNLGDGNDTISDSTGVSDRILFGAGINQNDISFHRPSGSNDLQVNIAGGGSIYIQNQTGFEYDTIETLELNDGSVITEQEIRDIVINQSITNGDDTVDGYVDRDDTLSGGQGNDLLRGDFGNDTYLYNLGDGNDTIYDVTGTDTLVLGPGISASDLSYSASGDDALISIAGGGSILIQEHLLLSSRKIETLQFDDGSSLTAQEVADLANANPSTNNAPTVVNPLADQNATEGTGFNFTFSANAFNDADGDTLAYSVTLNDGSALPSWLSFDTGSRTFSGTPTSGDVGTLSIRVIADDGNGGTVNDVFDITVDVAAPAGNQITGTNNPENLYGTSDADIISALGGLDGIYAYAGNDTVSSGAENDYIELGAGNDVILISSLTDSSTAHGVDYIGDFTQGEDKIDVSALGYTDISELSTYSQTGYSEILDSANGFMIRFNAAYNFTNDDFIFAGGGGGSNNTAPTVANAIADQNATEDSAFDFQFNNNVFADADGDALTYNASLSNGNALPAWLSFNGSTRTFSGTPDTGDVGTISVEVTANDGNGGTVSDAFDITIASSGGGSTGNPINGTDNGEDINGTSADDIIDGKGGVDNIFDHAGNDTISSGAGEDYIELGSGADVLLIRDLTDSSNSSGIDYVANFTQGFDKIDVSAIAGLSDVSQFSTYSETGYYEYSHIGGDFAIGFAEDITLTNADFIFS